MTTQVAVRATPYSWPHDGALAPETTALLIIDMQKDFCAKGGYVDHAGYDVAAAQALIPAIEAVRARLSDWGGLVVHTREGHRADLSDLPPLKRWRSQNAGAGIGEAGPLGKLLVRGEPGWEIVEPLTPKEGEPVIDKPGYSAFHATDLQQILSVRGITHLIFTGVTTDICVNSTLRAAVEHGYECLTLSDCCAATEPANHDAALRTIATEGGIFGAVATSEDFLQGLAKAAR